MSTPDANAEGVDLDVAERIGEQLTSLRAQRGLKISDLARRISVSPSLISQIERGQSRPSVGTLFALAQQLDVPVDAFFATAGEQAAPGPPATPGLEPEQARRDLGAVWQAGAALADTEYSVLNERDRPCVEIRGGVRWERLTATAIPGVEFLQLIYAPGAESDSQLYRHPGLEAVLVTEGQFDITIGFDTHHLHPGDSIAFPSSLPHRYINPTTTTSRAITVILRDTLSTLQGFGSTPEDEGGAGADAGD